MYVNGSEEFNKAIDDTVNTALHHRLVFTDDNSVIESISKLNGYISSNNTSELQIGTTNMSYVEVEAYTDKILTGREFRLESGVKLEDGTYEYAPIGYFTVQKPDGDLDIQSFKAFDRMQKLERPYSSSLTEPTTTDKILVEISEICRVTLATQIPTPIEVAKIPQGYTCREVLGYIAGLHAKFACFDRFGELNLRWYSETPIEKKLGVIWSFTRSQENFTVEKIEIAKDGETNYTSGSGYKTVFHSNPLATQEITNSIMATLNGFTYNASSIEMLDDIRLDPWDVIKVEYLDGNTYLVPCMAITQNFSDGSTVVQAYAKSDTENEYRFTGPTIQYLNRMAMELLVANRVIATKVDADYVQSHAITTDNLDAITANITNLVVDKIDGKYADIKLANIDIADIGAFFADSGLLKDVTVVDGHITGELDAVRINADVITTGTLSVDRLLVTGKDSIVYQINVDSSGLSETELEKEVYQKYLNGTDIVANSITATQLNVSQIFADKTVTSTLFAQDITATGTITGAKLIGADAKISSGKIGGFNITSNELLFENYNLTYGFTYNKVYFNSFGISPSRASEHKVLFAGGNPTVITGGTYDEENNKYWANPDSVEYSFYVTADGYMSSNKGKIGNWEITNNSLIGTGSGWFSPTKEDLEFLSNAITNNTTSSFTETQRKAYDFDANGAIDLFDFANCKALVLGDKNVSELSAYTPINSDITVQLDPSNPNKFIRLTGTNSFGRDVDIYFGLDGINAPRIDTSFINTYEITIQDRILSPLLEVIDENNNIVAKNVYANGDVIAGYGTSNQVSLRQLKTNTTVKAAGKKISLSGNGDLGKYLEYDIPVGYSLLSIATYQLSGSGYYITSHSFDESTRKLKVWFYAISNLNCIMECDVFLMNSNNLTS